MNNKPRIPEEGEIVLCKVTKILYHSVFVELEEYPGLDGIIHISEISPGRIRNLRDFVKEGKQIVCKVLNINLEKHQLELSLRRVNQSQRLSKIQDFKLEQRSKKIIELMSKELNKKYEDLNKLLAPRLIEEYGTIYQGFERIVADSELIEPFKLDNKTKEVVLKILNDKIKPKTVEVQGILELKSKKPTGIKDIKDILNKVQKGEIHVNYISAPKYRVTINASDYKTAEGLLKQVQEDALLMIKEKGGSGSFTKIK